MILKLIQKFNPCVNNYLIENLHLVSHDRQAEIQETLDTLRGMQAVLTHEVADQEASEHLLRMEHQLRCLAFINLRLCSQIILHFRWVRLL